MGYATLSRARDRTRLYASAESLGLSGADRRHPGAIRAALARRFQRTQTQTMALEEYADEGPRE